MASTTEKVLSPGNAFSSSSFQMRTPNLELLFRLEADLSPSDTVVGEPFGGGQTRVIMPIIGGTIKGDTISGKLENLGSADCLTCVDGADLMLLNARYTIKTDDDHFLYIRSKGLCSGAPGRPAVHADPTVALTSITQDEVEWFTHMKIEAGAGPYNWMNGIVAVGVLAMHEARLFIDAYRLTNFPGLAPRDIMVD